METDSIASSADPLSWGIPIFQPTQSNFTFLFISIVLLLVVSALMSGTGTACFALNSDDRQKLAGNKTGRRALKNLEDPEKLLATILVANSFINISIIILTAVAALGTFDFSGSPVWAFAGLVAAGTVILLLFGEILPKVFATRFPLFFVRSTAFPLAVLEKIVHPLNRILTSPASMINKRLHKQHKNISIDDISQALELTSEKGISEEKEILEGIVKFGNKSVVEIMCPRVDVVALDMKTSFAGVLEVINTSGYSRMPVYAESFDNVRGILYIKDLLPHTGKAGNFNWQNLIRPPFFVPETKKISSLLEDFQKNKVHMAVVVDEYGGSSGIVTLEDVLEEIVGDISDEFDEEETFYTKLSDKKFLFDGKTLLVDFYKITGCDEALFDEVKGDADTLAGLILELKGEIPPVNEKIDCKNFRFSIEAVTNRRIKQIKVEIK